MFGADKKYLTISINDGIIKIAQVTSSGSLQKVARGPYTASSSGDEGARALKALLSSFNRKLPVICVIPASAATAKNIEVPSADPEEIKSIVNLQAPRHTPYSREEVLISYINLGLNTSNNTRLLLVIVHRDVVKERISILEKSGLDIDRILFVPETQARFYSKALNLKKDGHPAGIIDFSLNATSYMILSKGTLLFVRHIPIGIKAIIQGGAETVTKLQDELKKSMDAFMQEDGNEAPKTYVVTTATEAVKQIFPVLKEGLNIDFQVNAFSSLIKGPMDVRKKMQNDFSDDSFLDVIAPASTVLKCEINLMPDEMIQKKSLDRQSKEGFLAGAAVLIIMVLVFVMIKANIGFQELYLTKNLREKFDPQKTQVQVLEAQMYKAKLVREYIKGRMVSLDIIHGLSAITPNTIYLNGITVDDNGTISIDGISESMGMVYSYVKSIEDSSVFKEAKLKNTSTKKDNGKDVAAFEIEFKWNPSTSLSTKEPA